MKRLVDKDTEAVWVAKLAARLPLGVIPLVRNGLHETIRHTFSPLPPPLLLPCLILT